MGIAMLELDHLAISGETLEAATAHVEDTLGVKLQPGGNHAAFSTHNTLLGLEDGLYIEAIAKDPDAPPARHTPIFDLASFTGPARLTNWICRTQHLQRLLTEMPDGLGPALPLARSDLRWLMTAPPSGVIPFDNLMPYMIEWQTSPHPATKLAPSGLRLHRLFISHPKADAMITLLAPHFTDARVVIENGPNAILAEFDTPHGRRLLE